MEKRKKRNKRLKARALEQKQKNDLAKKVLMNQIEKIANTYCSCENPKPIQGAVLYCDNCHFKIKQI